MGVILGGLGLAVLTYSDGALWPLVFFAILFSFADGINSVTWALVGDFFGRKHFATIRGWIGMIQSFVSMPARGVHRLDLRPDAELHLCADPVHRFLRRGGVAPVAAASPRPPDSARGSRTGPPALTSVKA